MVAGFFESGYNMPNGAWTKRVIFLPRKREFFAGIGLGGASHPESAQRGASGENDT
jgi:hypothetical protein